MNIDCTMYRKIIANVKAWTRGREWIETGALPVNFVKQSRRDVRDFYFLWIIFCIIAIIITRDNKYLLYLPYIMRIFYKCEKIFIVYRNFIENAAQKGMV